MGKDPAFLFYDGDAARDVSHMNRLERGCYFDFIQAQKKFGALSLQMIRKVLGSDFESCWEALKICLTYEKDMYYISWLQNSIEKRQKYSEGRSKNRKGSKQPEKKEFDETYVEHMVIENETVIINSKEEKGGVGEKEAQLLTGEIWHDECCMGLKIEMPQFKILLTDFINEQKAKESFVGRPLRELKRHFVSWAKIEISKPTYQTNNTSASPFLMDIRKK